MSIGRSDPARSFPNASTSLAAAFGTPGTAGRASGTSARAESTSSGRASTTGPGRPDAAVWNARLTYSGIRSVWSTWATHLAISPYMRR